MGAEQSLEQAESASASPFSRLLPKTNATSPPVRTDGVIVVSGPSQSLPGQSEIEKLAKIPLFSPFIKSSVNLFGFDSAAIDGSSSSSLAATSPAAGLGGTAPMLDSRALAAISTRLQEHLRQCAEAVAFDQNALCNRMGEIDLSIAAAHSCLSERHRRYTRLCEQLSQTKDMCALAAKVRAGVEQTHRGLYELNALLPADLRLPIPEQPPKSELDVSTSSISVDISAKFDATSSASSTSSHLQGIDERPSPNISNNQDENNEQSPASRTESS